MRTDLPTSEQIMEDLADKVSVQIERSAPVAFESALRELEQYHRFLMAVHAVSGSDGRPGNYGEVDAGWFRPPHAEWVGQYDRLFERAADRLADDPGIIRRLSYVPLALLPRDGDPPLSPGLVGGVLDLGPTLVHHLQTWMTRRTLPGTAAELPLDRRLGLRGSDARAYEDAIDGFVGAWEQLVHRGVTLARSPARREENEGDSWQACGSAWALLWRHLEDTARCLVICVRNEDEVGAASLSEALLRWPENLVSPLDDPGVFEDGRLLLPDVLELSWEHALARIRPLLPERMPAPSPQRVLASLLRTSHSDVRLITASLLASWAMRGKQGAKCASATAMALLSPRISDDDAYPGDGRPYGFRPRVMDVLRLRIAGGGFAQRGYGQDLDHLVAVLDALTERRVVPGRAFVPSTLSRLDDLGTSFLAILLAVVPGGGDPEILLRTSDWALHVARLPRGDGSLRDMVDDADRFRRVLDDPPPELVDGVGALSPGTDVAVAVGALRTVFAEIGATLSRIRAERLASAPVDQARLELARQTVATALLRPNGGIARFEGYTVALAASPPDGGEEHDVRLVLTVDKGRLVEPPMGQYDPGPFDHLARVVADRALSDVMGSFQRRERIRHDIPADVDDAAFWKEVAVLAAQVGDRPLLVLSRLSEGQSLHRLLRLRSQEARALGIFTDDRDRSHGRHGHMARVGRLRVVGGQLAPGRALLFSTRALRRVTYVQAKDVTSPISLAVASSDGKDVDVSVTYKQAVSWGPEPIFDLHVGRRDLDA